MSECGKSECMGHGHYEICGKVGQMGVFECDGCKVERLSAENEKLEYIIHLIMGGPMPVTSESLRELADWMESND